MRLSMKLPIAAASLALFSIAATSVATLTVSARLSSHDAIEKLDALADARRNELRHYRTTIENDIRELAKQRVVQKAVSDLTDAMMSIGSGAGTELQQRYIVQNTNSPDKRDEMSSAGKDRYDELHERYHPLFQRFAGTQVYSDILLADLNGHVVYSLKKKADFGATLTGPEWKDTGLGKAFRTTAEGTDKNSIAFATYENYEALGGPAGFIALPVDSVSGKIGVLIFEMPDKPLNRIVGNRLGMGETGETLLLDDNGYFLTDSGQTAETEILKQRIDPALFQDADPQTVVNASLPDFRGESARIAITGIDFFGARWHVAAVMASHEAFATVTALINWTLIAALGVLVVTLGVGIWFSRALTRPISILLKDMKQLAAGDTEIDCSMQKRTDEIGDMMRSVMVFRDAMQDRVRLEAQTEATRSENEQERRNRDGIRAEEAAQIDTAVDLLASALERLADGDLTARIEQPFMAGLDRLRIDFNASLTRLAQTLQDLRGRIVRIHTDSSEMSGAVSQLARRTEFQAASLEEASVALNSITETVRRTAENAAQATRIANEAKQGSERSGVVVHDAVTAMGRIEASSQSISHIVGAIDEIAFQTNLLALNAGVEAARAGDAGKGFAVVAHEVRELAQRSARAAKEISAIIRQSVNEVESGVSLVQAAGDALRDISLQVRQIDHQMMQIAGDAQDQVVCLQEVNETVLELDRMTQQNNAMVEESTAMTVRLSQEALGLSQLVEQFRVSGSELYPVGAIVNEIQPEPMRRSA